MQHRVVIERRDVPHGEVRRPDAERDLRPQQKRENSSNVAVPRDRTEHAGRQHEHEQRPADGNDDQRDAEIPDEHVLEHVHP